MIAQNTQPAVLSAGSITGDSVVNRKGENLGKIEELMVDTSSGQISYAVLSFGGFLGMGDKLFAMPWKALELDQVNERFILDVPKERLENAPGFDKDNWPSFADDRFKQSVNTYYSDYTRNRISGRLASPASRTVETAAPSRGSFSQREVSRQFFIL